MKTRSQEPIARLLHAPIFAVGALTGLSVMVLAQYFQMQHAINALIGGTIVLAAASSIARWIHRHQQLIRLMQYTLQAWRAHQQLPLHTTRYAPSFTTMLIDFKHMFDQALVMHRQQIDLRMQLSASQHTITQLQSQHQLRGEMKTLFSSIRSIAKEMDDAASRYGAAGSTCESFDALREQSFNLQLLLRGMEMLNERSSCIAVTESINPTAILSRILLPLSSALDARAMKLSSAAWSERTSVRMPPPALELIGWLVLLGIVRYAEDESELTLSCEPATDGSATFITCLISELAPASMHASERASFMNTKEKHTSAHMFAHTLAQSPNIKIACALSQRYGAALSIHSHTPTRCLIELTLPC